MPWFPDFIAAVELVRMQTRATARADPVMQYFSALNQGDTAALETVWPGDVVVYNPRAGRTDRPNLSSAHHAHGGRTGRRKTSSTKRAPTRRSARVTSRPHLVGVGSCGGTGRGR